MATRKLIKRTYLGEGYVHQFINNKTKKVVFVPCTKAEYERLGTKGGRAHNPTLRGHTWVNSAGGTIKVDTPNTMLGVDEYTDLPDGRKAVYVQDTVEDVREQLVAPDAIDATNTLDEAKLNIPIKKIISKKLNII